MKKEKKLSGIGAGIVLALCISFLFGIYAPLELYLTNISEFWLKLTDLVPAAAVIFGVCFIGLSVAYIIARLINKKFYGVCLAVGSAFLLSTYIQGNFLIKNLPSMSGEIIKWNTYTSEIIKSALAFVIPFAILLFVLIKFKTKIMSKVAFIGGICFTLLFAVTLTSLCMTTDLSKPETLASTEKNEFQMSEDRNLLVLILDTIDSNNFIKAIESDPEVVDSLNGFTYYKNTLAAYPYTSRAIPMLFSGKWFENETSYQEYATSAISGSPFVKALEKDNYNICFYETGEFGLTAEAFKGRFDNCYTSSVNYKTKYIYGLTIKMAGLKFAPWILKQYCGNIDEYENLARNVNSEYKQFNWSDLEFYNKVKDSNPVTTTSEKCARIIHLEGGHIPCNRDKYFNLTESGNFQGKLEACTTMLRQYFARLKESGVYDNTAIVIVADHGFAGNDLSDEYNLKKRMNPALLVKGVGEKHKLQYNDAPIAYDEIADGIAKLVDKTTGDKIFDTAEGETKTRRMILFAYNDENHMAEYTTDGRADDPDSMIATGNKYDAK